MSIYIQNRVLVNTYYLTVRENNESNGSQKVKLVERCYTNNLIHRVTVKLIYTHLKRKLVAMSMGEGCYLPTDDLFARLYYKRLL